VNVLATMVIAAAKVTSFVFIMNSGKVDIVNVLKF